MDAKGYYKMITEIDIRHWKEEFESYAKGQNLNTAKDVHTNAYVNQLVQQLWDAYLAGCINMMNLVLDKTRIGLVP